MKLVDHFVAPLPIHHRYYYNRRTDSTMHSTVSHFGKPRIYIGHYFNLIDSNKQYREKTAKTAMPPKHDKRQWHLNGNVISTSTRAVRPYSLIVYKCFQCNNNSSTGSINCFVLSAPSLVNTIARLSEKMSNRVSMSSSR